MKSIFISHTRAGSDKAKLLADILNKSNINIHLLSDITAGSDWQAEIQAMIRRCSLFVAIVDEPGPNVMLELGYALGIAKPVILIAGREANIPFDIAAFPVTRFDGDEMGAVYDLAEKMSSMLRDEDNITQQLVAGRQSLRYLLEYPECLEGISPKEFETVISNYFTELGLHVAPSNLTHDEGYDICLRDPNTSQLTIVEVKKYARNSKLGVSSVHQLLGSMVHTNASSAILITTSGFSASAMDLAQKVNRNIKLLTLEQLLKESRESLFESHQNNPKVHDNSNLQQHESTNESILTDLFSTNTIIDIDNISCKPVKLQFAEICAQIKANLIDPLQQSDWIPDLVIASGKGGGFCASLITPSLAGKKVIPLRLIDVNYVKSMKIPDLKALQEDDVKDARRILIVESSRRTGHTFSAIESKIRQLNSRAELLDYVLVFSPSSDEIKDNPPQCYSYVSSKLDKDSIRFPWYI